jgi:hypothetical protein
MATQSTTSLKLDSETKARVRCPPPLSNGLDTVDRPQKAHFV